MKPLSIKKWALTLIALKILTLFIFLLSLSLGGKIIWPFGVLSPEDHNILWISRLPRVFLALMTGYALGTSGTAFQGLLQNSLADPYILGVSSGAALGSILGLAFHLPFEMIPLLSFASAFGAMILVYTLASKNKQVTPHTLLLTGVILNAFLFAFILLLNGLVSFEQSQKIIFLLMGNIGTESFDKLLLVTVFVFVGSLFLTREGYVLNLLSSGAESAATSGIDVPRHRKRIFFYASLMIGAVVPLAGLVGFIGLFVPHITRFILGPDHRLVIPASGWIGAIVLMLCDTLARSALIWTSYQTELPVGAITPLLGAPFFLFLLKKELR